MDRSVGFAAKLRSRWRKAPSISTPSAKGLPLALWAPLCTARTQVRQRAGVDANKRAEEIATPRCAKGIRGRLRRMVCAQRGLPALIFSVGLREPLARSWHRRSSCVQLLALAARFFDHYRRSVNCLSRWVVPPVQTRALRYSDCRNGVGPMAAIWRTNRLAAPCYPVKDRSVDHHQPQAVPSNGPPRSPGGASQGMTSSANHEGESPA